MPFLWLKPILAISTRRPHCVIQKKGSKGEQPVCVCSCHLCKLEGQQACCHLKSPMYPACETECKTLKCHLRMRSLTLRSLVPQIPPGHADFPWLPLLVCKAQYSLQQCQEQQQHQEGEEFYNGRAMDLFHVVEDLRNTDVRMLANEHSFQGRAMNSSSNNSSSSSHFPCLLTAYYQEQQGLSVELEGWRLETCPTQHALW